MSVVSIFLPRDIAGGLEFATDALLSQNGVFVCVLFVYLQRLEEAKRAQPPATRHQTEGGIVEHLLVVVPAKTQQRHTRSEFTDM